MRVEILANNRASFVLPMAEGLQRMLKDCGADAPLHTDGLAQLMRAPQLDLSTPRSLASSAVRLLPNRRNFRNFVERLSGADAIVVVLNVPASFSPSLFPNIELLRKALPNTPIVNYDLHYLPTLESWSKVLLKGTETKLAPENLEFFKKGSFGLERYDWYLMASVGTHVPLEPGNHPYSLIGLDMDDGTLFPDQKEFQVLLDFAIERGHYPNYRKTHLEALKKSGVRYEVLEGSYSRDEIRAIYRRSGALILAHAEGFGLPIVECQLCGSTIWLPDPHWASAHWLGDDYRSKREPHFTSNFVFYNDDADDIVRRLRHAADSFNPLKVRETLIREQPLFYRGDRSELQRFLNAIASGAINSKSHQEYRSIGREPLNRRW